MHIGVVGATGEVGRMMLRVMEEKRINVSELDLFSSPKSAGTILKYHNDEIRVKKLTSTAMQQSYDYLLFSAGSRVSGEYALIAEQSGNTVIDNSSAFRKTRPLIVPEVNGSLLKDYQGIIANPNCSTIQMVLALYPLHLSFGLEEVVVSTYQSVSGAGNQGVRALEAERENLPAKSPFPVKIDLNVIPQIGAISENGYCEEELKMVNETRKIMNLPKLRIAVTTVRVPVMYGHSETIFARFREKVVMNNLPEIYRSYPETVFSEAGYLTPGQIENSDKNHIARVRRGVDDFSLLLWNVAHNIRLGAATNAVKIMQSLMTFRETRREY